MNGPSNWEYRNDLKEIPVPRKGEVLIKVEATVINPSDTYFMRGFYSGEFSYPLIPGSEGSGTVISSGGGLMGWSLVGKRVAFVKPTERPGKYSRDGAYAEYIVANAMMCVTLPNNMSFEQGATMILNPLSAVGMLDYLYGRKVRAVVQTSAYSQFGRMMIRLFDENNIPCINVVRKDDQVTILKEEYKQKYVLNSEDPNFEKELKQLCKDLNVNFALECVAGETCGRIVNCLPDKATCLLFGNLSEQKVSGINNLHFLAHHITIEGWFLPYHLKTKNTLQLYRLQKASLRLAEETKIYKTVGLHEFKESIEDYLKDMSRGKFILKPSLSQ